MAVAAAPTPAGLVHSTLAEAGHPSPTAGLRHPMGRHAIAPESLLRPAPEAGRHGRWDRGCLLAVHLVRLDGPGAAEARLDGPGPAEAHPVRHGSPSARGCCGLRARRWRAGVMGRACPSPPPYH